MTAAGSSVPQPGMPLWEQRFRAARVGLPEWAADAPHRCLYVANPSGTSELYAWDRATGTVRQVTSREAGTHEGALTPDGEWVWWFDDSDGDEWGVWRRQPFLGGPDTVAAPGVPAAYSAGLALGASRAVVGRSDSEGSTVHVVEADRSRVLYQHPEDAEVVDLAPGDDLVLLEHSEHGDSRHRALRVLAVDGTVIADLWDGPGLGLHGVGFSPVPGDGRVLAMHERTGRALPLVWDPRTGEETTVDPGLPGELGASWYADASALLVQADHEGRSTLHRVELDGSSTRLPVPAGTVLDATARPDGTVELRWSSAAEPPVVLTVGGGVLLAPPGPPPPPSLPVTGVHVPGPGGPVHALVARPPGPGPFPTVFLAHGGPMYHDTDCFEADRAAYLDLGCAVVQVNFRGSTGYGAAWRDAITGRPGLTELEDIAAVRAWAVAEGVAGRCVIAGGSWGGYLALLALGTQPELWDAGVAAVPVADYVAAYEDEMEQLQAFDRALFGGSPEQVPDVYRASSPLTYADAVRAPLLVIAGANDPRCPIRQIENYLEALTARGFAHRVYRYDAGHGSLVVDERVHQMRVELAFLAEVLGLPEPG